MLDNFLQAFDGAVPSRRDAIQEHTCLLKSSCIEGIQHFSASFLMRHEPRAFEHLQVFHYCLARNVGTAGQRCRGLCAMLAESSYDREPSAVAEGGEDVRYRAARHVQRTA